MPIAMTKKKRMYEWNLTAKTILHVDDWKELFDKAEYKLIIGLYLKNLR